jgi:hypothetical protein
MLAGILATNVHARFHHIHQSLPLKQSTRVEGASICYVVTPWKCWRILDRLKVRMT